MSVDWPQRRAADRVTRDDTVMRQVAWPVVSKCCHVLPACVGFAMTMRPLWGCRSSHHITFCARLAGLTTSACSGPCLAGYFGVNTGLTTPVCTSVCSPGYACAAGSTNATAYTCPAGQFAAAKAATCTMCAAGQFGSTSALPTAACTASCVAGFYGATAGQSSPTCSGPCPAGYSCPSGSTNATAHVCPAGQYAPAASPSCLVCAAGRFGAAPGLTNSSCSGPCAAGYYGASTGALVVGVVVVVVVVVYRVIVPVELLTTPRLYLKR